MEEHAKVVLGANTTPVERAFVALGDKMKGFAHSFRDYFSETTKGFLGARGIERGFDFIMEKFRAVLQDIKRIKSEASAIDVSTDFLQTIENAGKVFNVTGQEMDTMLNKFVKTLPVGSDVEEEFNKMADKIAAIPDPADKARIAIEAFGRAGVRMLPILAQGSAKLKELGDSFAKYSEKEIEELEHANLALEKFESKTKTTTAKIITGFPLLFKGLGQIAGEKGVLGALSEFAKAATGGSMEAINKGIEKAIELEGGLSEAERETAKIKYKQITQNNELLSQYAEMMDAHDKLIEDEQYQNASLIERKELIEKSIIPLEKEIAESKTKAVEIQDKIKERTEDGLSSNKLQNELQQYQNRILKDQIELLSLVGKLKKNNADIDKLDQDLQKENKTKGKAKDAFEDTFRRTEKEAAESGDVTAGKAEKFHKSGEEKRLRGDEKGARSDFEKESQIKMGTYVSDENKGEYENDLKIANGRGPKGVRDYYANRAKNLREGVGSIKKSEQENDPFTKFTTAMKESDAKMEKILTELGIKVSSVTLADEKK